MRFRKTLTFLMLTMGLVFALSAWAQQKPFTREQVEGLVRVRFRVRSDRTIGLQQSETDWVMIRARS